MERSKIYSLQMLSLVLLPILIRSSSGATEPLAPALYVFGDSLFDSGNNNFLLTLAKANYKPYGASFVNQTSTGRFTNGKTVADFIAEYLRLPYSPPFLQFGNELPVTGLNYASSACGVLPETGLSTGICMELEDQVNLFDKTVNMLLKSNFNNSKEALAKHLSKSIFAISIGSNDYFQYSNDFFNDKSSPYTPPQFARLVVDKFSQQLQRLYDLGARKIMLFEVGPIGCVPHIAKPTNHTGKCVEDRNQVVSEYNKMIPEMVKKLTATLKGSVFTGGHVHNLAYDAIVNPSKYGLVEVSEPCCKAWFKGTLSCIPLMKACENPNQHFFFDAFHPTEAIYSILASACIKDKSVCSPYTLPEFVRL